MLTHWLAMTMVLPAVMSAPSVASATPSFDEVQSDLGDWGLAMAEHAGGPAFTFEDVATAMAGSFWYEGLAYESPYTISGNVEPAAKLARSCKKRYGAHGVVRREFSRFLACLAISSFENANGDNGFDWSEAAPGNLPPPFRKYRAKLGRLAKDHWLVVSHFHEAEQHLELWNLYLVDRRPDRRIAGVLVGRVNRLPGRGDHVRGLTAPIH
jgi:hypothetical protein